MAEFTTETTQEVFNIPEAKDRVLVRECELTPQKALDVCETLVQYLRDSGMVTTPTGGGETPE